MIPKEALLSISNGFVESQTKEMLELKNYPGAIAFDFIGEVESDESVRGIIRDMLLDNLTIPAC